MTSRTAVTFVSSAFTLARSIPRPSLRSSRLIRVARRARPQLAMVSTSAPGRLDTDSNGGVLMFPRGGNIRINPGPALSDVVSDLLVIAVHAPEGDDPLVLPPEVAALADGALVDVVSDSDFKAKAGSSTDSIRILAPGPKRIILYGLGKRCDGLHSVYGAAKFAVEKGIPIKSCTSVSLYVDDPVSEIVAHVAEGAIVGGYVDERYKEKHEDNTVPSELLVVGAQSGKKFEEGVARGSAIGLGVLTTKEVISAPANALTPHTLATAARNVADEAGLDIKVLGRDECQELGMGSYLGVGRGSTDEPQFIHMSYKPEGEIKKKLCIVGKAVTFDSGGTNLKVGASSMVELMKFDMGGSGVALGTAKAIGALKPKGVEVHFIMPAVENMLGDRSIHPGDILKASNGKTIEVINTDAEGRLCLADGIVYAENLGDVDYVVDIATLTGAIVVALGEEVAGMFTSSDEFSEELMSCSKDVGEKFWRMPLVDSYAEGLKSKIADLRNIGTGRAASSIVAALFLREFVKTKNWVHLDIAGTVWNDKKGGATGFGVKTMVKWIESHSV